VAADINAEGVHNSLLCGIMAVPEGSPLCELQPETARAGLRSAPRRGCSSEE
jgi:hypothetical protein